MDSKPVQQDTVDHFRSSQKQLLALRDLAHAVDIVHGRSGASGVALGDKARTVERIADLLFREVHELSSQVARYNRQFLEEPEE